MNHWDLIDTEQLEIYQDHIVYRGLRLSLTREQLSAAATACSLRYPGHFTKLILTHYNTELRNLKINQVLND